MKSAMAEAEQIMADAVGASRGFLERGIARTERVRMQSSKGKRTAQKHNGLWEERNRGKRKRRKPGEYAEPPEIIERRLSMEMNRSDFTAHNAWAKRHSEYFDRISAKSIRVEDAQFSRGVVTKPPVYADNPEFLPRTTGPGTTDQRFEAMEKWLKRNPEPSPKFAATPQQLAETLLHEIVHSLDYSTGTSIDGISTVLRRKLKLDGIDKLAAEAYRDGDAAMWYAAKGTRGKPGETIADITRMYFFGDRYDADQVLKTALEWRAKYPEMALWVEDNVLTLI
jgi:hypothetical protein